MFLAADLGGTKTALTLFRRDRGPREPVVERIFPSQNLVSLEQAVAQFLEEARAEAGKVDLKAAAFGVAGPVIGREAKITNLTWTVSIDGLAEAMRLDARKIALLNDLEATANAVPQLTANDLHILNAGMPTAHAPIAVIAPGTGLGQAYLTWDGSQYRPHASEGGHVDFAPCNPLQLELLNYLYQRYDHVSFERVVSGMGIPDIYRFLRDSGRADEPATLADALAQASDPTAVIMSRTQEFPICRATLNLFVAILGAKSGNVALSLMSRGGVYLGGGIPPRILPSLETDIFLEPFKSKGRFRKMMELIPVRVITNPKTPLLGASYAALALDAACSE